ncbi:hypothetical protein LCGC14_2674850 [marine sediment metagenome]|uniref:Uncharacterized protein n=1 Tax=marine sediment metagenome TaxID=412755 RepID=A0A0F9CEV0_9ZZZZ
MKEHIKKQVYLKKIIRWSPKGLSIFDIVNIVQKYGTDNDSLLDEEYDENTVQWEIVIKAKKK